MDKIPRNVSIRITASDDLDGCRTLSTISEWHIDPALTISVSNFSSVRFRMHTTALRLFAVPHGELRTNGDLAYIL